MVEYATNAGMAVNPASGLASPCDKESQADFATSIPANAKICLDNATSDSLHSQFPSPLSTYPHCLTSISWPTASLNAVADNTSSISAGVVETGVVDKEDNSPELRLTSVISASKGSQPTTKTSPLGDKLPTKRSKSHSGKRKVKETPVPSMRKRHRTKGPTKLRKGKQLIAEVPMDIWEMILSYCPAKFLGRARRINRSFHRALQYDSAWRRNRLQNHGTEMPGPFGGMREDDYANLREGLGCMGCPNRKTRKTYWIWQKRWCIDCFEKNTVKEETAITLVGDHLKVLQNCIPYGLVDSWGRYEMAGFYDRSWSRQGHGHHRVYGKADIRRILDEWEEFTKPDAEGNSQTVAKTDDWFETKTKTRDRIMQHSQLVEHWAEKSVRERLSENTKTKRERAKFFQDRAKGLSPPLEFEALRLIEAYRRAVDIARPPTERAWKALLPKIEKDRAAAERVIEEKRLRAIKGNKDRREQIEYLQRLSRRAAGDSAEQLLLTQITEEVLKEFNESPVPIADADFPILVLRGVRQKYYQMADDYESLGPQPVQYRLLLEDARWVFEKIISKRMDQWGSARSKAAKEFKCLGCTRNDTNIKYSFETLFCHLRERHAAELGDFSYLFREGLEMVTTVHWLNIEWPINLPILAQHHVATGRWDPHDETPYVRYQPAADAMLTAFDGRKVTHEGPDDGDMLKYITFAGRLLHEKPLDGNSKTSIVLKYAVEKCRVMVGDSTFLPPIQDVEGLPVLLVRTGLYEIFNDSRCALCKRHDGYTSREMTRIHSIGTLIAHFKERHPTVKNWPQNMMVLPDDCQLRRNLNDPAAERVRVIFDQLFPHASLPRMDLGSLPSTSLFPPPQSTLTLCAAQSIDAPTVASPPKPTPKLQSTSVLDSVSSSSHEQSGTQSGSERIGGHKAGASPAEECMGSEPRSRE